jgi:hypothetical protein
MTASYSTPWHRRSYDRFVHERLPQLLAERLPLTGYEAEPVGRYTCRLCVAVAGHGGEVSCQYDLPQPDEEGVFDIAGRPHVVVPLAAHEDLRAWARAHRTCRGMSRSCGPGCRWFPGWPSSWRGKLSRSTASTGWLATPTCAGSS